MVPFRIVVQSSWLLPIVVRASGLRLAAPSPPPWDWPREVSSGDLARAKVRVGVSV